MDFPANSLLSDLAQAPLWLQAVTGIFILGQIGVLVLFVHALLSHLLGVKPLPSANEDDWNV